MVTLKFNEWDASFAKCAKGNHWHTHIGVGLPSGRQFILNTYPSGFGHLIIQLPKFVDVILGEDKSFLKPVDKIFSSHIFKFKSD